MPSLVRSLLNVYAALAILIFSPLPTYAQDDAVMEEGRRVFLELSEPKCSICHSLADAGATGEIGPDLDSLQPTEERVRTAVVNGSEAMPAYAETLTEEQIDSVARYVATVVGQQ